MTTKLAPHIQQYSDAAKRWVAQGKPPAVKSINDLAPLRDAPEGALRIYRVYVGDNNLDRGFVFKAIMDGLGGYRHPNLYVEPVNMINQWDSGGIDFFADLGARFREQGIKVAGPTWGDGQPEPSVWQAWRNRGWPGIDLISLHMYWGVKGFTKYHALRFKELWRPGDPPVIGVEGGREKFTDDETGMGGWVKDGLSRDQFYAELVAFDQILAGLDYVKGFTPFTLGPNQDWTNYNMDPLVDLILAGAPSPVLPPPPTDSPPPPTSTAEIARIEAIYGITHKDGANIYLAELVERTDPPEISAEAPEGSICYVSTADNFWQTPTQRVASLSFEHPAAYQPTEGEHGYYYAACEDAWVKGLGWAYDKPPVMQGPHTNVRVRWARRTTPVIVPPPAADDGGWQLAFADYYRAHPEIGKAIGPIAYIPEPGVWRTASQVSATHMLIWDGDEVRVVPR